MLMDILITDDSEFIRTSMIKSLQSIKKINNIYVAKDAAQAIESLKEFKPDVLLLDIKMPGGTGFDVLKLAKKEKLVDLVIILTNYTFPHYKAKSLEYGADYFFDKSMDFEKVIQVLDEYQEK